MCLQVPSPLHDNNTHTGSSSSMGRRKVYIENVENTSPNQFIRSSTNQSLKVMQTRSTKSNSGTETGKAGKDKPPPSGDEYPASALIQEIVTSISSDTEKPQSPRTSTAAGTSRSPLAESSCNEQTPEKSTDSEYVSRLVDLAGQSEATPTTNLKILCEVADKNESVSSADELIEVEVLQGSDGETRRRAAEPVTPTANLKMLITAASPEIRSLELSKSRLFADDEDDDDEMDDTMDDMDAHSPGSAPKRKGKADARGGVSARKQKSLGILCRRLVVAETISYLL